MPPLSHPSQGYLYQLDARLARFMESAELAGLPLPLTEARLRRVLLDTAAASLKMHGAAAPACSAAPATGLWRRQRQSQCTQLPVCLARSR
jgi:hypothetical protein